MTPEPSHEFPNHIRMAAQPQCDFCSKPHPEWRWACQSFGIPEHRWASSQDWAACDTCNDMILHKEWTKLAVHSAKSYAGYANLSMFTQAAIVQAIYKLHQKFAASRLSLTPTRITSNEAANA